MLKPLWRLRRVRIVVYILAIMLGFWALSGTALRYGLSAFYEGQGATSVDIAEASFNPFNLRLSARDLVVNYGDTTPLKASYLQANLKPLGLFQRRLHIGEVQLEGVEVTLENQADAFIAAGIRTDKNATPEPEPEPTEPSRWQLRLDTLSIQQSMVAFNNPTRQDRLQIDDLRLTDLTLGNASQELIVTATFGHNNTQLDAQIQLDLEPDSGFIASRLTLNNLPLSEAQPWLPEGLTLQSGALAATQQITLNQASRQAFNLSQSGTLTLSDAELTWQGQPYRASELVVETDATLNLADNAVDQSEGQFNLRGNLLNGSPIQGQGQWSWRTDAGNAEIELTLEQVDITQAAAFLPADIDVQQGLANIQQRYQVTVADHSINLKQRGEMALTDFHGRYQDAWLEAAALNLNLNADMTLAQQALQGLDAELSLAADGYRLYDANNNTLLRFDQLLIPELRLQHQGDADNAQRIQIPSIQLNGVMASDQADEAIEPALQFAAMTIGPIDTNLNRISLGDIQLESLQTALVLNPEKQWRNWVEPPWGAADQSEGKTTPESEAMANNGQVPATDEPQSPAADTAEPQQGGAIQWSLNSIQVSGDSRLRFLDESVKPSADVTLSIDEFKLGPLNSQTPAELTPVTFTASIDDYSRIHTEGTVAPLADDLALTLATQVEQLPLNALSGYVAKSLNYAIDQGQFGLTSETAIAEGMIDSQNTLRLLQFRMRPVQEKNGFAFGPSLPRPLDTTLNLLRDSKGNVELNVPVSGPLESFSVGWVSITQKILSNALSKATLATLKTALLPYNTLLGAADLAFGTGGKVVVKPLRFELGNVELTEAHQPYVNDLIKLLQDQPKLTVDLCGVAHVSEQTIVPGLLYTEEQLIALATQRAENLKQRLAQEPGIGSERIFLCTPQLDDAEGRMPRITVSF